MSQQPMTLMVAIRNYINGDPNSKNVEIQELKDFKNSCSDADRAQYKTELEAPGFIIKD